MVTGQFVDPIAQKLLELRKVSASQWLLRTAGAVATVLALMLTLGGPALFAGFGTTLITLVVLLGVLLQCWRPDTDLGLLAPAMLLLVLLGQGDLTMLRAAGVGLALLLAHSAFALAATIPVHGDLSPSAWRLAGAGLLPVLVLSLVAAALVVLLSSVQLGSWMMVLGVLAVIALFAVALPRARQERRGR